MIIDQTSDFSTTVFFSCILTSVGMKAPSHDVDVKTAHLQGVVHDYFILQVSDNKGLTRLK